MPGLGGQPPKYTSPVVLQAKIDEYFLTGVTKRKCIVGPAAHREVVLLDVPTISGLTLYLGFADRQSFYAMEKRPEFTHTIKAARTRIQQVYEEQLHTNHPVGAIFALKNFDWTDKQEFLLPEPTDGLLVALLQEMRRAVPQEQMGDFIRHLRSMAHAGNGHSSPN